MTERYSRRHYSVDDRRAIQLVQLRWPASGGPRVPRFSWKTADLGLALRVYIWTERCDHSGPRIPAVRFRSLRPAGPERRDARRPVHMRWATLFVYVSLSLSLFFYLCPCTPASADLLLSLLSLRPRDPTRRWLRISSPPSSSFSLCLRHACSLSFSALLPRLPRLFYTFSREQRISSALPMNRILSLLLFTRSFAIYVPPSIRLWKDRGLRTAVTLLLSASTKGRVRSITFDRPYSTSRYPYSFPTGSNKLESRWGNGTPKKRTTDAYQRACSIRNFYLCAGLSKNQISPILGVRFLKKTIT